VDGGGNHGLCRRIEVRTQKGRENLSKQGWTELPEARNARRRRQPDKYLLWNTQNNRACCFETQKLINPSAI